MTWTGAQDVMDELLVFHAVCYPFMCHKLKVKSKVFDVITRGYSKLNINFLIVLQLLRSHS